MGSSLGCRGLGVLQTNPPYLIFFRLSRERGRDDRGPQSRQNRSDWDHETPRSDRRQGGVAGETPYSKIKGKLAVEGRCLFMQHFSYLLVTFHFRIGYSFSHFVGPHPFLRLQELGEPMGHAFPCPQWGQRHRNKVRREKKKNFVHENFLNSAVTLPIQVDQGHAPSHAHSQIQCMG